jgi:hypothetical protein
VDDLDLYIFYLMYVFPISFSTSALYLCVPCFPCFPSYFLPVVPLIPCIFYSSETRFWNGKLILDISRRCIEYILLWGRGETCLGFIIRDVK